MRKSHSKISDAMLILRLMDHSQLIALLKFFSNIKVQNKYRKFTQKQEDNGCAVNNNIGGEDLHSSLDNLDDFCLTNLTWSKIIVNLFSVTLSVGQWPKLGEFHWHNELSVFLKYSVFDLLFYKLCLSWVESKNTPGIKGEKKPFRLI